MSLVPNESLRYRSDYPGDRDSIRMLLSFVESAARANKCNVLLSIGKDQSFEQQLNEFIKKLEKGI